MIWRLLLSFSFMAAATLAQQKDQNFVIDASKPYVYLQFDHIGGREPLSPDESQEGLWLRLVNNCRLPILVATFNPGTGDPGIGVFHEVIIIPPPRGRMAPPLQGPKLEEKPGEKAPDGYSWDVATTTTIEPGDNLLFSVPLNHVGPKWYLQMRFDLDLPGSVYGTEPWSAVSFHWQDIPEKFRKPDHVSGSPKPTTR